MLKEIKRFLNSSEIKKFQKSFRYEEDFFSIRETITNLCEYTLLPYYEKLGRPIRRSIYNFLIEPLKNSNYYALKDTNNEGVFELFYSPKSFIAGYFDGGEYFKKEDVKECWENRIFHKEKANVNIKGIGHGVGTQIIYEFANFIFIDNLEGKLYTGINFEENVVFQEKIINQTNA